jgi:hypothetical protein
MVNGWTLERRQRQAELIQRWKPWQHSTGARTEEGKEISKMNALKHGCYTASAMAVLEQVQELLNRRGLNSWGSP